MTSRFSLPLRSLAAALAMGAAGCALAAAITRLLGSIANPSFERALVPAGFTVSVLDDRTGAMTWPWVVVVAAALLVPPLINRAWLSRRLLSIAGIVKLVAAATLLALVVVLALIGTDLFTHGPWGGGAERTLAARGVLATLAGLCGGALFHFFAEGMPGGAPDRWIVPRATRAGIGREFARGFAAAVSISVLSFVTGGALKLLFDALGWLGESAEVSALGWARLELGLSLGLGLLFAACGGLLVALSPAVEPTPRLASLGVAAVPIAALVALSLWFKGYVGGAGEMNTTLARAAGLESAPAPRLMVLPGRRVVPYAMEVATVGWVADTIGATSRNIELTEQYLTRLGDRWTAHTVGARHVAAVVYERLLQPEAALRARADAAEGTGSILSAAVLAARIPRMQRSDAVREVTARLLDTARFVGGRQSREKLESDADAPRDRAVSGAVQLPERLRDGVRVALYWQGTADLPATAPPAARLVAALSPDARGRFEFAGLPPAVYSLGVLLPERFGTDPNSVVVDGALRVVDLSGARRREDAGTIRVSLRP